MDQLLKFITPVLIKLNEPNKNHSIAIKMFYQKSFDSNTIGANHRPEIHENHRCTDRWRALHCSFFSRQSAKTYKFQSQFKFQPTNQFIHPEGNEHIPKRVVPFELHT